MLFGNRSTIMPAMAYGSFTGLTLGARHWLEMSILEDIERDRYAAYCGTLTVGIAATILVTLLLSSNAESTMYVYRLYGIICLIGALFAAIISRQHHRYRLPIPYPSSGNLNSLPVCPLFFLESGLFGITHTLSSASAVKALGSASHFSGATTAAGIAGGIALYFMRKKRDMENRAHWLGASCFVVAFSFILLGMSASIPLLYIGYQILKALASPFLLASEQVLNQRTLDVRGTLADRILAREFILWVLCMLSLCLFWALALNFSPTHMLASGSGLLAITTGMEYLIGQSWFWSNARELRRTA